MFFFKTFFSETFNLILSVMIDWFVSILREYPQLALFLTLGVGFLIGRIKFGNFQLGSVTAVLLVGAVVGQADISIPGPIKSFFFMMFLFSIGYTVGPDFFRSLKGSGLKQALFAVVMSSTCCGITLLMAYILGYTKGETLGLFSGSQTCSALLGVGSEAIQKLGLPDDVLKREMDIIPVCYAVTYIYGTLGTVILLGNFGPRLLGGLEKVKAKTMELEHTLNKNAENTDPAVINAQRDVAYRIYQADGEFFNSPRTVSELEKMLADNGMCVYVDHISRNGEVKIPDYDDILHHGDHVVLCGRIEFMVNVESFVGKEIDDKRLQRYPLTRLKIVVSKIQGKSLAEMRSEGMLHGVVVRDAMRNGDLLAVEGETVFEKGDIITVIGRDANVNRAIAAIGHGDRPSISSDLAFVGLAIFIGGLIGALTFWVKEIPISFGTSGGALISGLVFGWLRSKRPTFGFIPKSAVWIMNNLGLNVFIAVIGITSAPSFMSGIREVGPMLLLMGAVGTTVPLLVGLWLGQKVFKFNPAITLGCCAGTRTCTAALGAVQTTLGSSIPAIGYTVTYAVSNVLLVIWGLLTVLVAP